jgi:hypothetical protein
MAAREVFVRITREVAAAYTRDHADEPLCDWEAAAIIAVARRAAREGLTGSAFRGFRVCNNCVVPAYGYSIDGGEHMFVISGSEPPVFIRGGTATCLNDVMQLVVEFLSLRMPPAGSITPQQVVEVAIESDELGAHFRAAGVPDTRNDLAHGVLVALVALRGEHAGPDRISALAAQFRTADAVYRRGDEAFAAWLAERAIV